MPGDARKSPNQPTQARKKKSNVQNYVQNSVDDIFFDIAYLVGIFFRQGPTWGIAKPLRA